MKRLRDEGGQALIITALCMTCLFGFVALAADVGILLREKRLAQAAADSAAIAGALEINYGDSLNAAQTAAGQNGFTNGSGGASVTVNGPPGGPLNGPHAGNANFVEVVVSQSQPTIFMGFFGRSSMTVAARAVAQLGPSPNCIYTLGNGTAFAINNGATFQATSCGIIDDSNSGSALTAAGGAHLIAQSIAVVGNYSSSNGATISPTPTTGVVTVSDPLSYLQAPTFNAASCVADPVRGVFGNYNIGPPGGGTICYNGLSIANGATVTLQPGLYIINGAMSVGGGTTVTATGVTFYFPTSGSLVLSNGATLNLAAPTSGSNNGILFWQAQGNASTITINGGTNSTLKGAIYAPSAQLSLSNGIGSTIYVDLVVSSINVTGGANFQSYAALPGTTSPITSVKLVE